MSCASIIRGSLAEQKKMTIQSKLGISLVVSVLTVCATAQDFQELGLGGLAPPSGTDWRSVATGDVDGDGDLDQVFACYGAVGAGDRNFWLRGDGTGVFERMPDNALQMAPSLSRAVVLGDFDGDGDLDAFFGNEGADAICRNSGAGYLILSPGDLPSIVRETHAAAAGDIDGDGDLDIVCACNGFDILYLNDGTGTFTDASANLPGVASESVDLDLYDYDGDGDLDLVLAHLDVPSQLLWNDGAGAFTVSAAQLPRAALITAGDVDGDSDRDIVAVAYGNVPTVGNWYSLRLYRNDGSGLFSVEGLQVVGSLWTFPPVELADLDGDNDLDLAVPTEGVRFNDGTGTFVQGTSQPWIGLFFEDVDGDGDLDQVGEPTLRNDGSGAFEHTTAVLDSSEWNAITYADMDADGDLDLVRWRINELEVVANDGTGKIRGQIAQHTGSMPGSGRWLARDWNGDGHLDFLMVGLARYYQSVAGASFVEVTLPEPVWGAVSFDVDGDGDLDIVWNRPSVGIFWSSYHAGAFAATTATTIASPLGLKDSADLDGDGREDLIYQEANGVGSGLAWARCTGLGVFTPMPNAFPVVSERFSAVHPADFDGDGDLDIAAGHWVNGAIPRLLVLENDGSGQFTTGASLLPPPDGYRVGSLHTADFDGDGDADLLVGPGPNTAQTARLLRNDGGLAFVEVTGNGDLWRGLHAPSAASMFVGDFDSDGDLDIAAEGLPHTAILTNLERQLLARGEPATGTNWRLCVTQRPVGGSLAAVIVGLTELVPGVATPFGELRVDPLTAMISGLVLVNTYEPATVLTLAIPNDPTLQGLEIFAQHIGFDGVDVRLGNQIAATVRQQ
ncbi:MAG: hypothetical protein ACI9SE_002593 [Neolewinella sp.]|jgi:hypothetical protein